MLSFSSPVKCMVIFSLKKSSVLFIISNFMQYLWKQLKKVSNLINEFTFGDHLVFEKVIELNRLRDCIKNVLSECDQKEENLRKKVLDVIDDMSIEVIKKSVENVAKEIKNLKVNICQFLRLERLCKEGADEEDKKVITQDGKTKF